MTTDRWAPNEHEYFKELSALANSGTLTASEWGELKEHLQICEECREAYHEYLVLANEGIPMLAARYGQFSERTDWDDTATRREVFARLRATKHRCSSQADLQRPPAAHRNLVARMTTNPAARAAVAACLVVAMGLAAYRLGSRAQTGAKKAQASAEDRLQKLAEEKKSGDELLDTQARKLSELQDENSRKESKLVNLRSALRTLEERVNELTTASTTTGEQLRAVSRQRDALNGQLRDVEQAFQKVQTEVASLRAEREKALLRSATLESRIDEVSVDNGDLERRLRDDERYLASDRDIRELMGARKLYIADVFDVDSGSRTRKPFGRVFYTQGKSLLFYAFDLDRQPGVKAASTFQAWGRKETDRGEDAQAKSLGILYKDSEQNRRWFLRCDDPEQLAQIDDVFVTVEPHGGSQKPTGKPFLYAMLRKEANHP